MKGVVCFDVSHGSNCDFLRNNLKPSDVTVEVLGSGLTSSAESASGKKVKPPDGYPPEEGRYVRGDDYSPVAVAAILDTIDSNIPPELSRIIVASIDSGAALAGTLQTENMGIEKLIANVVANPNIRYLVLCWRESKGHMPADAIMKLLKNGVDEERRIIGAEAPAPFLYNLQLEMIERFRGTDQTSQPDI